MPAQHQPDAEISKREYRACRSILIASARISDDPVEGLCRASYQWPRDYELFSAVIRRPAFCEMEQSELYRFFGIPENGGVAA